MSFSKKKYILGNDDTDEAARNKLEIQRDLGDLLQFEDALTGDEASTQKRYHDNKNDFYALTTGHHNNKNDFYELSTGHNKRDDFYNNKDDYFELATAQVNAYQPKPKTIFLHFQLVIIKETIFIIIKMIFLR